jgi:transposase InsO family protein
MGAILASTAATLAPWSARNSVASLLRNLLTAVALGLMSSLPLGYRRRLNPRKSNPQGSEYTARLFRAACQRLSICQSMGRPGSALDNAVIESWHSTVESGLRRVEHFATRAQARARVAAWIEDYNHSRRHSACGMMSPVAWELARGAGQEAA